MKIPIILTSLLFLLLPVNAAMGEDTFLKPPQAVIQKHTKIKKNEPNELAILTIFYQLHDIRQKSLEDNSAEQSLKFSTGAPLDYDTSDTDSLRNQRREAAEAMQVSGTVDGAELGRMRNIEIQAMHTAKLKFLKDWKNTLSGDDLQELDKFARTQKIKTSRTDWEAVGKDDAAYLLENSL